MKLVVDSYPSVETDVVISPPELYSLSMKFGIASQLVKSVYA